MSASTMRTPVGPMPIRPEVIEEMAAKTDLQIANEALKSGPFVNPEYYSELCDRGLSGPGMTTEDTMEKIFQRIHDEAFEAGLKCQTCFYMEQHEQRHPYGDGSAAENFRECNVVHFDFCPAVQEARHETV